MLTFIVAFRRFLFLFHDVERGMGGGGVGLVSIRAGGMAESWWAGTVICKDHLLVGVHICPYPY